MPAASDALKSEPFKTMSLTVTMSRSGTTHTTTPADSTFSIRVSKQRISHLIHFMPSLIQSD